MHMYMSFDEKYMYSSLFFFVLSSHHNYCDLHVCTLPPALVRSMERGLVECTCLRTLPAPFSTSSSTNVRRHLIASRMHIHVIV